MQQGFSRFLILLAVFFAGFLAVIIVRKTQDGASLFDLIKDRDSSPLVQDESYTLKDKPSLDLSDVKVLAAINQESASLVHAVIPSVVSIDTTGVRHERRRDSWGRTWVQPRAVQGQGSGVIVTEEGHVLTNHHVIQGNPKIHLTMHSGKEYSAKIIGSDPTVDIAVLKIDGEGPFTPLKFGDSTQTQVGNIVYAIGSPFGLGESVTNGIISAKKRSFSDSQVDLLQTSAAINPGNSGGPLVNIQGEIIGINSRIYSTDKKNPGFQGISFAIPSNDSLRTMQRILAQGRHERGFLGMALEEMNPASRAQFNYQKLGGVRIAGLAPDGPAMKAGLKKNDVILQFNEQTVINAHQLITMIQQSKVSTQVPLKIWRKGASQSITAKIGAAKNFNQLLLRKEERNTIKNSNSEATLKAIGLKLRTPSFAEQQKGIQGVFIEQITSESQLKGKLITGDLIAAINGKPVQNKEELLHLLMSSLAVQNTELYIQRGKNSIWLTLKPIRK